MWIFLLFVIVSVVDLVFTINGINNGIINEGSPFINKLKEYSLFNIYESIIASKVLFLMVGYWLVNDCHIRLERKLEKLTFKSLAREGTTNKVLIILTVITALLGALPSLLINLHYIIYFSKR